VTGWHHDPGVFGALEQTPHNDVHGLVGGPSGFMGAFDTAPLDPVFWLHHANIDRLWESWRKGVPGADPNDVNGWTGPPPSRFSSPNPTGSRGNFRPGKCWTRSPRNSITNMNT
jgi:tyrosinase